MAKLFFNKDLNNVFADLKYDYEDMLTLMKDTARGNIQEGYTKQQCEDKIREMMFAVLELDPADMAKPKFFNRALRKNHEKLFEVIEDVVEDMLVQGWHEDEFFMNFVEDRNLSDGDREDFYTEEEVILNVARVSGEHHDLSIQRLGAGKSYTVPTSVYAIKVGADIRAFLAGRIDWTKLVNAIYRAFDVKIKDTVYQEVSNIGNKLPVSATFNKAIELNAGTKDQVDTLLDDVAAANGVGSVMIIGTPAALRKLNALTPIEWTSEAMKNEKYKTGRLGYYEGTALIETPQRLKKTGGKITHMLKDDQLLVLPESVDKFIKLVNTGDAKILEKTQEGDYMDDLMTFEYQKRFGVSVQIGKYIGNIKITG